MTNTEVAAVLLEPCDSLEHVPSQETTRSCPHPRRSIVDPSAMRMMGPRTTSTSAKVNRRVLVQRTHMADTFQVNTLGRSKKPSNAKRRHVCSICRGEGHHPRRASTSWRRTTRNGRTSTSNGSSGRTRRRRTWNCGPRGGLMPLSASSRNEFGRSQALHEMATPEMRALKPANHKRL